MLIRQGILLGYDSQPVLRPDSTDARMRKIETVIPVSALRKSVNVLTVQLRRTPYLELYYKAQRPAKKQWEWSTLGFHSLTLTLRGSCKIFSDVCSTWKTSVWL